MPLAEGMRKLVNDLKRQRKARHNAVAGNREIVRQMTEENKAYLASIHKRNKAAAAESRQMLKSSGDARKADYAALMKSIREDLDRVHQAKEAITQGSKAAMQEFRDDHKMAQSYWADVATDDLIGDDSAVVSNEPMAKDTASAVVAPKKPILTSKKNKKQVPKEINPVIDSKDSKEDKLNKDINTTQQVPVNEANQKSLSE
jgi:hypothetical protein